MDVAWRTDGGKTQSSNKHEMKTKEIREFPLCSLYLYFFWLAAIFCLRHLFGLWRSVQHAKKNTHISLEMFTVGPSQSRVPDNSHSRTPFLRQTLYRMPSLCKPNALHICTKKCFDFISLTDLFVCECRILLLFQWTFVHILWSARGNVFVRVLCLRV